MNAKVVQIRPQQITPKVIDLARSAKVVSFPVRQMLLRRAA